VRPFEAYTWQHALPIAFFLITGFFLIRQSRAWTEVVKRKVGVSVACVILALMAGGTLITLVQGNFNYKEDLPLYLCRIIAWMLPFVVWYKSKFWMGVFYFWILAGTLQGTITPDLKEGFPDYFYFRYWFLHAGLVMAILYVILAFRMRITWKHFWYAIGLTQVYLLCVHVINLIIDSNYSYTVAKPPASVLDMMGPWPWYLLAGEGLMFALYALLMLPWLKTKQDQKMHQSTFTNRPL
jgi:hypothetical integral membrane protein (TIGR02206 family)